MNTCRAKFRTSPKIVPPASSVHRMHSSYLKANVERLKWNKTWRNFIKVTNITVQYECCWIRGLKQEWRRWVRVRCERDKKIKEKPLILCMNYAHLHCIPN